MIKNGVYILANDVVYDQLVALLNSIEVNVSSDIPVCIIPYNQKLNLVKKEVDSRSNVSIYSNLESLKRWDEFAKEVWSVHPAVKKKEPRNRWYKSPLLRKFAAFDGEFDNFVFYDADSLAMKPLDNVFQKLNEYDFVFDDWEHIKPLSATALDIPLMEKSKLYTEAQVRPKLHCSSFFASKKGIFAPDEISRMKQLLVEEGEIAWVTRWWDDAFLFNYLTLRCERPLFNYTLSQNGEDKTGNCANVDSFINVDNVLYNQDGLKPIHRLHYMGYSSSSFARLSRGEDVNIRYQEEFLYYRFLKQPEKRPKKLNPPNLLSKTQQLIQKASQKMQLIISS
jgi:hypothetical protein